MNPSTISNPARDTSAKPVQDVRGNLKPAEIKPLVMAARKAFDIQRDLGNLDVGETFDTWRHAQCLAAVGQPGITACSHEDYRPLLAHFQTLAGADVAAFNSHMAAGRASSANGDTREARRHLAWLIAGAIAGQKPVAGSDPISPGYILTIVRHKTRRPNLTFGSDWQASLADRCTVHQLTQIRDTIVNRIAAREGRGTSATRNKSQRSSRTGSPLHSDPRF